MKERMFDSWSFAENVTEDPDQWFVKLEGGKYHGAVFNYGSIKVLEDEEQISFDYDVVDFMIEDPHGRPEFNKVVGGILTDILEDAISAKDYVIGERNTNGTK